MDKKSTLGFILIAAILIIWLFMNTPKQVEQPAGSTDTTQMAAADTLSKKMPVKKEAAEEKTPKKPVTAAKQASQDTLSLGKYFTRSKGKGKIITIDNSLVRMEITTHGADIKKYYLKKFKNWYSAHSDTSKDFYASHVQLVNYPEGGGGPDLAFVSSDGKAINTSELEFQTNADKALYKLSGKDSLSLSFTVSAGNNQYIKKIYTFYGDRYNMRVSVVLAGMNNIISNKLIRISE